MYVPRSRKSKHQPNQQKMKIPQGEWVRTSDLVGAEGWWVRGVGRGRAQQRAWTKRVHAARCMMKHTSTYLVARPSLQRRAAPAVRH